MLAKSGQKYIIAYKMHIKSGAQWKEKNNIVLHPCLNVNNSKLTTEMNKIRHFEVAIYERGLIKI